MPVDLIILGAGGHARVVIDALQSMDARIVGICDPALPAGSRGPFGIRGLGGDEVLERFDPARVQLVNGIGSIGNPKLRIAVYERLSSKGWMFAPVIHPSAVIGAECEIGAGSQIMAGAVLQVGTRIGANAIVNTRVSIDHDCMIGDHAHIAPGAVLCGDVMVGTATHIGSGAVVIQGLSIGAGALVGAGMLVTSNMGDNSRVTASLAPSRVAARTPIVEKLHDR
ncbi:MAG: acetyltransferase [Alphaproteobacteria bacterium]|nr:acetyltransferase [Alphaproteobacteria bacterium]